MTTNTATVKDANKAKVATSKKSKELLYVGIYCIIASFGWVIEPIGAITTEGMKLLGIFFAAVFGWSITSHVWPSMLTFVLLPYVGLKDLGGLVIAGWGSDTFIFIILAFVIIAYLEVSGTSAYIAAWLMTRKFLIGHPWRLIFMLFLVAWLLCTFVNAFAGMFLTWGIIYKICNILGYKPYEKFPSLLLFGVAVMGALSLSTVPWNHNALVILSAFTNTTGIEINMLHYLAYSIPFGLSSIMAFLLLCRWVFRLDVSKLKEINLNFFSKEDLMLNKQRKIAMVSIGALVAMILLPSILPPELLFTQLLVKMGLTNKALLVFFVLSLINVDGKPIFEFGKLATKGVPWNMVLMMMVILTFVGLLGMQETGISSFLSGILTPIFADVSLIWFFVITLVVTVCLTNFMINMVVAVIMMSATIPIAANLGVPAEQVAYLLSVCCTIAFMLPASSLASTILFSNTEWIKAKDVYIFAVPTVILLSVLALFWNILLFSLT